MEFKIFLVILLSLRDNQVSSYDANQLQLREMMPDHLPVDRIKRSKRSHHCSPVERPKYPRDCSDLQSTCPNKTLVSGEYEIQPDHYPSPFLVYCDFTPEGEAWTVIQRRMDGSINFQRNWHDYKNGFGFLRTEFWLGNEKLSYLTAQYDYELRVDLRNQHDQPFYAVYNSFRVGDESMNYRLVLGSHYTGDAGNSLVHQNMAFFTTYDADHDSSSGENCASNNQHGGGWWYTQCDSCNLNARYGVFSDYNPGGIDWDNLPGGKLGLTRTEMKIRPVS